MASYPAKQIYEPGYQSPEMHRFVTKYFLDKTIQSGRFNDVSLGKHRATQKKVIIKTIYTKYYRKLKEASFLKKLVNVPGVITYLDQYYINPHLHLLVLEYFGEMTLKRFLNQYGPISECTTHTIFKQLVSTVHSCFSMNILHRKIKLSNILINVRSLQIKLINFNSASHFDNDNDQFNTTLCTEIAPPEYFTKRIYSADGLYIWTLGLVLYEMLFNRQPFSCPNNVVRTPCSVYSKKPLSLDVELLVSWMLTKLSNKRITINELTHHPWISKKWI